eukprot:TRINITY_DN60146_c0_g1_i1.p1 TRINITY_DN60146_c0_g1~~TRINITY_DN60146_c0_g1_i1.p1  ORF type:complete len:298 (+),score=22.08 TRINITY_DN60146_c0_g1_i1:62-955(+)
MVRKFADRSSNELREPLRLRDRPCSLKADRTGDAVVSFVRKFTQVAAQTLGDGCNHRSRSKCLDSSQGDSKETVSSRTNSQTTQSASRTASSVTASTRSSGSVQARGRPIGTEERRVARVSARSTKRRPDQVCILTRAVAPTGGGGGSVGGGGGHDPAYRRGRTHQAVLASRRLPARTNSPSLSRAVWTSSGEDKLRSTVRPSTARSGTTPTSFFQAPFAKRAASAFTPRPQSAGTCSRPTTASRPSRPTAASRPARPTTASRPCAMARRAVYRQTAQGADVLVLTSAPSSRMCTAR